MRFLFLITLLAPLQTYAVPCIWDAGTIPATIDNGQFNTLTCADDIIISGSIDLNSITLADPEKPLLIETSGTFTIQSGFSLTLNGSNGGASFGGIGVLGGSGGGDSSACAPLNGIGYPKPLGVNGGGIAGDNGIAAEIGGGGGGGTFLSLTSANGTTVNANGGSRGSLITNAVFNFDTLFFGGTGGGAGGCGNANATQGGAGGAGAGAIKIVAQNIIFEANTNLLANGGTGESVGSPGAGGGGGSGGALYLSVSQNITFNLNATLNALGGTGGNGGASGGTGGQGVIRIEYGGEIIGGGAISPTPTLVDTNTTSVQQQLEKFSSDISCAVIPRQKVPATFWQIILGFGLALVLIKRKKTTNF